MSSQQRRDTKYGDPLTQRDKEIIRGICCHGFSNLELGKMVGLSKLTIAQELNIIYRKVGVGKDRKLFVWYWLKGGKEIVNA